MIPVTKEARKLFFDGAKTFADISNNGVPVNVKYVRQQIKSLSAEAIEIKKNIHNLKELKIWRRVYGDKFNIGSRDQLADILYNKIGITPTVFTEKNNPSVSAAALNSIGRKSNSELPQALLRISKLAHISAKLKEIYREQVNGVLHPTFALHTAITYRSSSFDPNFQSQDVHDEYSAKILRSSYQHPDSNFGIGEVDFKGIEVCVNACVNKDPNLIKHVTYPDKYDMHRTQATKLFFLKADEVDKSIRFASKNGFVFPEFYGDYYAQDRKSVV